MNTPPRQSQPRSCPQRADPCQWISAQRCPHPAAPLTAAAPRQSPGALGTLTDRWPRLVRDEQGGQGSGQNHQRCPPSERAARCRKAPRPTTTPPQVAAQATPQDRTAASVTCTAQRAHPTARTAHQARALSGRAGQGSARLARQARRVRRSWAQLTPGRGRLFLPAASPGALCRYRLSTQGTSAHATTWAARPVARGVQPIWSGPAQAAQLRAYRPTVTVIGSNSKVPYYEYRTFPEWIGFCFEWASA